MNSKANRHSVGVVLFQLGGPDSLQAVEPFLYNLFSDPDIIDFPLARLARPTLARLISSRRAKKVEAHYRSIGGRSPIRELTERQARALEGELRKTLDARVFVAMRYWHPLTEEAARAVGARGFRQLVLMPLYPQYSTTTTGSSLNEWRRKFQPMNGTRVTVVEDFHRHPAYIDAVVEKINEGLARFDLPGRDLKRSASADQASTRAQDSSDAAPAARSKPYPDATSADFPQVDDVHLVFSAHSVPKKVIEAGDPYQAQVEATAKFVMERGGWPNPHRVCYQSRVGPGEWLKPSLAEALHSLAALGKKRLLLIPISFVTDHVETLSEIGIEARAEAERLGLGQFEVMPALNDSPKFIQALAELVQREVGR